MIIIGSGPSLTQADVDLCHGHDVIVVNNSYKLAPWAGALYSCDYAWWDHYRPEFAGLKYTQDAHAADDFGLIHVPSADKPGLGHGCIHLGRNSGYQAVNLAYLQGHNKILLVGFDFQGAHWHGSHQRPMNNPVNIGQWTGLFRQLVDDLKAVQVDVINCSRETALDVPRGTLEDELCKLAS